MKPVTDPDLLKLLEEGSAPPPPQPAQPVLDPELLKQLDAQPPAMEHPAYRSQSLSPEGQAYRIPENRERYDKPGPAEEFAGGMWHGLDKSAYGLKDIGTNLSPEEEQRLRQGSEFVKGTSGWSNLGQIGGELAGTSYIGAPLRWAGRGVKAGLKYALPKAAAALERVGKIGGRTATVGRGSAASAEGGAQAGMLMPEEDESRLGNAGLGFGGGFLLNTMPVAGAYGKKFVKSMSAAPAEAEERAGKVLVKTLTPKIVARDKKAIMEATESRLPQTAAARAGSQELGAVERGIRRDRPLFYIGHDREVKEQARDLLKIDTSDADALPKLLDPTNSPADYGKRELDRKIFANPKTAAAEKLDLWSRVEPYFDSDEVANDIALHRKLRAAVNPVTDAHRGGEVIAEAYAKLQDLKTKYPKSVAVDGVLRSLTQFADANAPGTLARIDLAKQIHEEGVKKGKAALRVREQFVKDDLNVGEVTADRLSRAVAKEEGKLDPQARADIGVTIDELKKHDIFKESKDTGSIRPDIGPQRNTAVSLANVTPWWRAKGPLSVLYRRADQATQRTIDKAMERPEEFLRVIEARKNSRKPLSEWEKALVQTLRQGTKTGAVVSGD